MCRDPWDPCCGPSKQELPSLAAFFYHGLLQFWAMLPFIGLPFHLCGNYGLVCGVQFTSSDHRPKHLGALLWEHASWASLAALCGRLVIYTQHRFKIIPVLSLLWIYQFFKGLVP